MLPKLLFAALLFLSTTLSAQTPAADTTIVGQTLPLLPIETLIAQLQRPANGPAIVHRQVAFRGRLFAPTSGLDTLRVPLDLEEVYFLDEVSFSQVAFLAPVRFERAHFAGGLSFAEARFTASFSQTQFDNAAYFEQAISPQPTQPTLHPSTQPTPPCTTNS